MYSKEYFIDRFYNEETHDLLNRYTTAELTDSAKEAILFILKQRGGSEEGIKLAAKQAKKASYRRTSGKRKCDYCDSSAIISYIINDGQRFCSTACLENARLMELSEDIPSEEIINFAYDLKNGECPDCHRNDSKIETRKHYRVWSAVIITSSTKQTHVCCKSCGRKINFESIMFCLVFGWWGIPWGILITPVQIILNIAEIFNAADDKIPSDDLVQRARIGLAATLAKKMGGKCLTLHSSGTAQKGGSPSILR